MLNSLAMILYVLISAFGLYKIKIAVQLLSIDFAIGFLMYGAGFLIWMYVLLRLPLSLAFPIAAGALIVSTQLIGYFFLDEKITVAHSIGVAAIFVGIALIAIRN